MHWTIEKPAEAGWYWLTNYGDDAATECKVFVIEVFVGEGYMVRLPYDCDSLYLLDDDRFAKCSWSTRLEEPTWEQPYPVHR